MQKPDIFKMTLREKIAQLLIVRMSDLIQDASTSYTKFRAPEEAAEIVKKNQFGGIWLHGAVDVNQINNVWNENVHFTPDELIAWYENVRKDVKIPMITANDAMSGTAEGLSIFPEGLAIGASSDENAAFELGRCTAREMGYLGTDWVWSPVVDWPNRRAAFVNRQFSCDQSDLIECTKKYIKGMQSEKVAATVKHFPGVDPYETRDSHVVTMNIRQSVEDWKKGQGKVFQAAIDAGVYAIMCLATAFPAAEPTQIDGRYLPAGLSYNILTKLLREEMGFKGVVITDDVNMGGFTSFYSGGRLYAEFIKAGNDMLLGVNVQAVDLIEEEVKKGTVSEERINEACARVLDLKEKVGLFERGYRKPDYTFEEAHADTGKMAKKLAETSLTLVRDRKGALPFKKENIKNVAIVCYTHAEGAFEALDTMKEEFEKHGLNAKLYRRLNNFEEAQTVADENDLIVYCGYINFHAPKGAPYFFGDEFWALRHAFVYGVEKSVGVSLGYPHIHYDVMDDANVFINAYNIADETQKAIVKAILGEIPLVGKTPVELD